MEESQRLKCSSFSEDYEVREVKLARKKIEKLRRKFMLRAQFKIKQLLIKNLSEKDFSIKNTQI